jgi:hypothetical protein
MVIKLPLERLGRHSHAGAWERENGYNGMANNALRCILKNRPAL